MARERGDNDVEKSENQDIHGQEMDAWAGTETQPMRPLKWNQRQKPRLFSLTEKIQMFNSASC